MIDTNFSNFTDYKILCNDKKNPKKSYQKGKTKRGMRAPSPDWRLIGKREKRILAKKDKIIDFRINDKFVNKFNKTRY